MLALLGGVIVGILAIAGVFEVDSDGAITVSAASAAAGGAMQISVLPEPPSEEGGRRSFSNPSFSRRSGLRRAGYDDAETDYSLFRGGERIEVPGSDTLDTVNMIVCFVARTGLFSVDPRSSPYQSLVDMSTCNTGERSSQKEIFLVTAYGGSVTTTTVTTTNVATRYRGNVGFKMNTDDAELRAEADITVHTVTGGSCPGVPMEQQGGEGSLTCWTGGMKWKEGSVMYGYFDGSYDATDDTHPVGLTFYESGTDNTAALVAEMSADGGAVNAKMLQDREGPATYYCLNANNTRARIGTAASESGSCLSTSSGGACLSRSTATRYPASFRAFNAATGAAVTVDGVTDLNLQYTKNGRRCHAGMSSDGSYMSCGRGEAGSSDFIADGDSATDFSGTAYTVHHSNAKIQKFTVASMTAAEFAGSSYLSYFAFVPGNNSAFWQYILGYTDNATNLDVMFKRSEVNNGNWTDFAAGSQGEKVFIGPGDHNFQPCKKDALWYTGSKKPSGPRSWDFVSDHDQWTLDATSGTVYYSKSLGSMDATTTTDLICPTICTRYDSNSGNCYEHTRCPRTAWSGFTPGQQCSGGSCTHFQWTTDTAYRYKFDSDSLQLQALQDNAGDPATAAAVDARTGVTYDPTQPWSGTLETIMYAGSTAADLDTAAEIAAYHKTGGNVFYRVGVGALGSYSGWSFYAKQAGQAVSLAAPITCGVTMGTDANGDNSHSGAKFDLTLYSGHTRGLKWEQLDFTAGDTGQRDRWVATPQLPDGILCEGDGVNYRLKAEFTEVQPTVASATDCAQWDSMTNTGTLPTTTIEPNNAATTTPTTTKVCVSEGRLTGNSGCHYFVGATTA